MKSSLLKVLAGLVILFFSLLLPSLAGAGELVGTVPGKLRTQAKACLQDLKDPNTFSSLIAVYTVRQAQIAGGTLTFSIDEAPQLPLQVKLRTDQEQGIRLLDRLRTNTAFVMFTRPNEGDPTDPERQAPRSALLDYTVLITTPHPWGEECNYIAEASSLTEGAFGSLPPTLQTLVTGLNAANTCGAAFIAQRFAPGSFFFRVTGAKYFPDRVSVTIEGTEINLGVNTPIDAITAKKLTESINLKRAYVRLVSSTPRGSATYEFTLDLYSILNPTQAWACTEPLTDITFSGVPAAALPPKMTGPAGGTHTVLTETIPQPKPAPSTSVCQAMIDDIRQTSIGHFAAAIPVEQLDSKTLGDVRNTGVRIPLTSEHAQAFTHDGQRAWYAYSFPNTNKVREALANKTPQPMLAGATGNLLVEMSPYECRKFADQPVTFSQLPRTNLQYVWLLALAEKKTRSDNIDNLDAASYGNALNLWQASLIQKLDDYLQFYY